MILIKITDHDLFRSKENEKVIPLYEEIAFSSDKLPALISSTKGEFLVSRKIFPGNVIRTGVFDYDSDKVDNILEKFYVAGLALSLEEKWDNVFSGKNAAQNAFNYIKRSSGLVGQPHVCLYPSSWIEDDIFTFFSKKKVDMNKRKYNKYCELVPSRVAYPVFVSRPDMVGLYTQYVGGKSSLVFHNVKLGVAFCVEE